MGLFLEKEGDTKLSSESNTFVRGTVPMESTSRVEDIGEEVSSPRVHSSCSSR